MATSAYPNAANTGVLDGTTLTTYNGTLVVTQDNAVISGLKITGNVVINAKNVTIENCVIDTTTPDHAILIPDGYTGFTLKNSEINGNGQTVNGISGSGTFLNNDIQGVENGINVYGASLIENNYIHALKGSSAAHFDGIENDGSSNVQILHNTIINDYDQTSAVMLDNEFGALQNITIDDNYLVGGGYTVYLDGRKSSATVDDSTIKITNNHIGDGYYGDFSFYNDNPVTSGNSNDLSLLSSILAGTATGGTTSGGTTDSSGSTTGTDTGSTGSGSGPSPAPNVGTPGDDYLSTDGLGSGVHTMTGFDGNDTYAFTGPNSIVDERGGSGFDTVVSTISVDLNNTDLFKGSIEAIRLTGLQASSAVGNTLDNLIEGNSASNVLNGRAGSDTISGGGGNDTITGGAGDDTFLFNTTLSRKTSVTITDFEKGHDHIALASANFAGLKAGALSADQFYVGSHAHDANDRIVYNSKTGALSYDADGNGPTTAVHFATLKPGLAIDCHDFLVI